MLSQNLATVTKRWTRTYGFLWHKRQAIEVTVQQVALPQDSIGLFATAQLTITIDGKLMLEESLPWPMPRAEIMLPLVVYMLARYPKYEHPEWRPVLMKFCSLCDGFTPPLALHWSRYSEVFD